ncbi:MAG: winged helix-turn-helix transcriptional regulator [Escherichia coli]|nr:winged helix-turn-helix transcriptional regulator [Escherichia coli]
MSQVSLSQQLKEGNLFAEQCPSREVLKHVTSRWGGFLNRIAYPVVPPHVEYSLTPLGEQVSEKVAALADWIELNLPEVLAVRDERAA